jgi:hypothetical protein
MLGQNFLPSSTLSLVFFLRLVFLLALLIFRISSFSSSFLSHLSSFLAIFFSCFFCSFFFKQWLLLKALVLLQIQALFQVMMESCMTWIKRLQCSFHVGLIACTSGDLFTTTKMEEGSGHFVDLTNGV